MGRTRRERPAASAGLRLAPGAPQSRRAAALARDLLAAHLSVTNNQERRRASLRRCTDVARDGDPVMLPALLAAQTALTAILCTSLAQALGTSPLDVLESLERLTIDEDVSVGFSL